MRFLDLFFFPFIGNKKSFVSKLNINLYLSCAKRKLSHEINDKLNEIYFGDSRLYDSCWHLIN